MNYDVVRARKTNRVGRAGRYEARRREARRPAGEVEGKKASSATIRGDAGEKKDSPR